MLTYSKISLYLTPNRTFTHSRLNLNEFNHKFYYVTIKNHYNNGFENHSLFLILIRTISIIHNFQFFCINEQTEFQQTTTLAISHIIIYCPILFHTCLTNNLYCLLTAFCRKHSRYLPIFQKFEGILYFTPRSKFQVNIQS